MAVSRTVLSPAKKSTRLRAEQVAKAILEVAIPFDEIAKRAYKKFVARGFVEGFLDQDWFDAENELRAEYRDMK